MGWQLIVQVVMSLVIVGMAFLGIVAVWCVR